jgi:hypothetical protein
VHDGWKRYKAVGYICLVIQKKETRWFVSDA